MRFAFFFFGFGFVMECGGSEVGELGLYMEMEWMDGFI